MFHHYRKWGVEARQGHRLVQAISGAQSLDARREAWRCAKPYALPQAGYHGEPITDTPAASRARHDRPRQLDPLMLFNRYTSDPTLCELSRKPRAARWAYLPQPLIGLTPRCAVRTIDIDRPGRGLPGRVVILGGVINIPVPGCYQGSR